MTAKLPIAAIQMVSAASVEPNLEAARRLVAQAAAGGAALVVLPEFFCLLGRKDTDKVDAKEAVGDGPIQCALADIARESGVWLIGGTVPIASSEPRRIRNACLVHRPDGTLAARYDKVHLFGLKRGEQKFDESATIQPGRTPTVCDVEGPDGTRWRVGLSVCYDLRFPELFRAMGQPDLILVPAAFTATTGRAHWETLLKARAIENLCYVLASAQGGVHENGRATFGHSMLIDPWGNVVARHAEGPGLAIGDITPHLTMRLRGQLPALAHRVL
jgi:predicted amidohydrolase